MKCWKACFKTGSFNSNHPRPSVNLRVFQSYSAISLYLYFDLDSSFIIFNQLNIDPAFCSIKGDIFVLDERRSKQSVVKGRMMLSFSASN